MEKLTRRLSFIQEDLIQMFPCVSDYETKRQMLDVLCSVMDFLNAIDLRRVK